MGEEQAVRDIMVKEVIAIRKDASIEELSSLLIENGISGVPVVDSKGTLVGMATEGDLIVKDFERLFTNLKRNREKVIVFLNEMEVEAIAGGYRDEQAAKIQNLLKSYFINRDLRLIAATTPEYYYK